MKLSLLFAGQGAQTVGMGHDFCSQFTVADQVFDRASEAAGIDLKKLCFEGPQDELTRTDVSQPAILATSIAILEVLLTEGKLEGNDIVGVAGLSLGEYAAHVAAGSLELEEAVKLVRTRGQLMQQAAQSNPGTMVSVIGLEEATLDEIVQTCQSVGTVVVANYNSPGQMVLSGDAAAVEKAATMAGEAGAKGCIPLKVAGAFHSPLMQSAADKLAEVLDRVPFKSPQVPAVTNVTGKVVDSVEEIPGLLARQVVSSVRWVDCVQTLVDMGTEHFLELGPGKVLSGLCRRIDRSVRCVPVNSVDSLEKLSD